MSPAWKPAALAYHDRKLAILANLWIGSSGIPPRAASGSNKPMGWKPVVLGHRHRELAVLANVWTEETYNMEPLR
jgi:hypothetical protein